MDGHHRSKAITNLRDTQQAFPEEVYVTVMFPLLRYEVFAFSERANYFGQETVIKLHYFDKIKLVDHLRNFRYQTNKTALWCSSLLKVVCKVTVPLFGNGFVSFLHRADHMHLRSRNEKVSEASCANLYEFYKYVLDSFFSVLVCLVGSCNFFMLLVVLNLFRSLTVMEVPMAFSTFTEFYGSFWPSCLTSQHTRQSPSNVF